MARGKRTDPTAAILAKVMGDMGFETGIIATVAELPRGTVKDIIQGNGPWALVPHNELYDLTKSRLTALIELIVNDVAMKAMAKMEQKVETASYSDLINFVGVALNKGESWR